MAPVDVVSYDDWVSSRSGRDGDFDLGVGGCEAGKGVFDEGTEEVLDRNEY